MISNDILKMMRRILHRLERRHTFWLRMSQKFAILASIVTRRRVHIPGPSSYEQEQVEKFQRLRRELDPSGRPSIERALSAITLEFPDLYSPLWESDGLGYYPPDSLYGECQQLFEKLAGEDIS